MGAGFCGKSYLGVYSHVGFSSKYRKARSAKAFKRVYLCFCSILKSTAKLLLFYQICKSTVRFFIHILRIIICTYQFFFCTFAANFEHIIQTPRGLQPKRFPVATKYVIYITANLNNARMSTSEQGCCSPSFASEGMYEGVACSYDALPRLSLAALVR